MQHFGKIGTGDITLLVQEIEKEEKERKEREEREKGAMTEDPTPSSTLSLGPAAAASDDRGVSPMLPTASAGAPASEETRGEGLSQTMALPDPPTQNGDSAPKESEADVRMEER